MSFWIRSWCLLCDDLVVSWSSSCPRSDGGTLMAQCYFCGAETALYVGKTPICLKCDEECDRGILAIPGRLLCRNYLTFLCIRKTSLCIRKTSSIPLG